MSQPLDLNLYSNYFYLIAELQNISNIQSHYEQIEKEMVGEKEKVKLLERQLNEATSKQADLVKEKEEVQGELALVSVLHYIMMASSLCTERGLH